MKGEEPFQDLVVLTPDKNTQWALDGLLTRPKDLGIRHVTRTIIAHPHRDPGVLQDAHQFLRAYLTRAQYAMVILDREGCGKENDSRETIEKEIQERLSRNGWKDRSAVIVVDPELENWVWSPSNRVAQVIGWGRDYASLEAWLMKEGYLRRPGGKPDRPKEANGSCTTSRENTPLVSALQRVG